MKNSDRLEPGPLAALQVFLAKFRLENGGVTTRLVNLQSNLSCESQVKPWPMEHQDDAEDHDINKHVLWIACSRVDAMRHERSRLWHYRERFSQVQSSRPHEDIPRNCRDGTHNAPGCPWALFHAGH